MNQSVQQLIQLLLYASVLNKLGFAIWAPVSFKLISYDELTTH